MDGTEFHDVTITVEDDKEDKIVVKANGDELRVETCEEGSLEEIQIARPVNMKMSSLLWQMWKCFEEYLNRKP